MKLRLGVRGCLMASFLLSHAAFVVLDPWPPSCPLPPPFASIRVPTRKTNTAHDREVQEEKRGHPSGRAERPFGATKRRHDGGV